MAAAFPDEDSAGAGVDWRVGTTHTERITYVLEKGLFSDVVINVGAGQEKKKFKAHKLALMTASPVFEEMLKKAKPIVNKESSDAGESSDDEFAVESDAEENKTEKDDDEDLEMTQIGGDNIEPSVFDQFLKFVYTGKWEEDSKVALPLLHAANYFKIPELAKMCRKTLKENLTEESALTIFQQAVLYNEIDMKEDVQAIICKFAYKIVDSEAFLELKEETLLELLKLDELAVKDEVQLFDALVRWAEAECVRNNHPITSKCCGSLLEKMIPLVRFPQMDKSEFATSVAFREILTPIQEQAYMMSSFLGVSTNPTLESRGPFNAAPRNYHLPTTFQEVCRLPDAKGLREHALPEVATKINWHRINFMAAEKVFLAGIGLNPPVSIPTVKDAVTGDKAISYSVEVKLQNVEMSIIHAAESKVIQSDSFKIDDKGNAIRGVFVTFEKPIKIEKNVCYTASLRITPHGGEYIGRCFSTKSNFATCKGSDGKVVKITFQTCTAKDSSPRTNEFQGQMARFGFLLY